MAEPSAGTVQRCADALLARLRVSPALSPSSYEAPLELGPRAISAWAHGCSQADKVVWRCVSLPLESDCPSQAAPGMSMQSRELDDYAASLGFKTSTAQYATQKSIPCVPAAPPERCRR